MSRTPSFNRRTATKVKDGCVQRKNRHRPTTYEGYVLDREPPGHGFRHVVTKRDLQAFIEIFPDWPKYAERLERIGLGPRTEFADGEYCFYRREETGAIWLHAWPEDLWVELTTAYFNEHAGLFERLDVSYDRKKHIVICRFTEAQARAFMLLHVFVYELGHHYDYLHQKHHGVSKGEAYAETFATGRFEQLFPAYVRVFGHPATAK